MSHTNHPFDDVRRLHPVDGERLSATWTDSEAAKALFEEITAMPDDNVTPPPVAQLPLPPPSRRRRWALAAGVAAAALAAVVVSGTMFDQSPAFAVRQLQDGVIEVNWIAEDFDGAALAAELREFGVDVDVETVPSSPSAVGRGFAGVDVPDTAVAGESTLPAGITAGEDGSHDALTWWIDPQEFKERLTLHLTVAAKDGEAYVLAEEVFEPGEVLGGLHCALEEPIRAEDVAPYLSDLDLQAEWNVIDPDPDDPGLITEMLATEVPDGTVMWGYAADDTTVRFSVLPDEVLLDPESYPPRLSDQPCTPEQAAAWTDDTGK